MASWGHSLARPSTTYCMDRHCPYCLATHCRAAVLVQQIVYAVLSCASLFLLRLAWEKLAEQYQRAALERVGQPRLIRRHIAIRPADRVVLAVGVVVTLLRAPELVA